MHRVRERRAGWLGALALAACSPDAQPGTRAAQVEVNKVGAPTKVESDPTPVAPITPPEPAVRPTNPGTVTAPGAAGTVATGEPNVPVTPISVANEPPLFPLPAAVDAATLERVTPAWELAMELDRAVELETLGGGVLARLAGVPHELGPDGTLVEKATADPRSPAALVKSTIDGAWPDDAWRVTTIESETDEPKLSFYKWRGGNRWVAQPVAGETVVARSMFASRRWTPRGGLLLVSTLDGTASFQRIAGKYGAPAPIAFGDGEVRDAFESIGGMSFLFVEPDAEGKQGRLMILRSCKKDEAPGCERSGGVELVRPGPDRGAYFTGAMAARGRWSMTAAVTSKLDPGSEAIDGSYLVHYETGGWKLEAVPGNAPVVQLLPAPDGSLWISLGGSKHSLAHRSAAGKWSAIDLPPRLAGTERFAVALRDAEHVWIAGNDGEHHAIYSVAATLQATAVPADPAG